MSALVNFSMKINGKYENFTMSINEKTDQYGNNASIFKQQSKEQREAKEKKEYVGNGKVTWTDGVITKAEFVERTKDEPKDLLPF
jgi:hypothetical protein